MHACEVPPAKHTHLKATLLGCTVLICFVFLLALLGHSSWQLMQQSLCYNVDPAAGRVPGLHIGEVWVHTEGKVAGQSPAMTKLSVRGLGTEIGCTRMLVRKDCHFSKLGSQC